MTSSTSQVLFLQFLHLPSCSDHSFLLLAPPSPVRPISGSNGGGISGSVGPRWAHLLVSELTLRMMITSIKYGEKQYNQDETETPVSSG